MALEPLSPNWPIANPEAKLLKPTYGQNPEPDSVQDTVEKTGLDKIAGGSNIFGVYNPDLNQEEILSTWICRISKRSID
uniref:Uncharacterized protein n=1 Tax=Romanomermis culicivorax TaxID=13658 RepID=A0A915JU62_ROMCU